METTEHQTLEQALACAEANAESTLAAARAVLSPLRKLRAAAQVGDLRALRTSMQDAEAALSGLSKEFAGVKKGWDFDAQGYLSSGGYTREIIAAGREKGVSIFEKDERLYCYPSLLKVAPGERAVVINRRRERRIRPSVLVNMLHQMQTRPPTFKLESFLTALFEVYCKIASSNGHDVLTLSPVVPLVDIYGMLTLLPGQAREYSKQDFAKDVYLLHRSGIDTTREGAKVSFPISRGVRGKIMLVIDETGEERHYFGIRFSRGQA